MLNLEALAPPHSIDPESLAALPRAAGVYVFWGEGRLPLYIGKSIDIRSRVLAHLRASDEAAMLAQARRVEFIETAGEIGALLLEARLIKQLSPLYNIRLRRLRNLCAIQLIETAKGLSPQIVSGKEVAVGLTEGLYGLFSSVRAAQAKLSELAQLHRLCRGLLGLEQIGPRGCFGLQLHSCLGACVGQEERQAHDQRLFNALLDLEVHAWPFSGAIDLVEQNGDWVQKHRIQGWRHLGTWCSRSGLNKAFVASSFDLDTYKILVKPILLNLVKYTLLTHSNS